MAAIDKLYIKSYYELDDLRRWAIVYYPELLFYMPNAFITYNEFEDRREQYVKQVKEHINRDYKRLSYGGSSDPVKNLKKYYKDTADYDCPDEQAIDEVKYCLDTIEKNDDELGEAFTLCAMHTPIKVDNKLKWICPVPCVREYLYKQCGVNPKRNWLYSLFWRGKKHFYVNSNRNILRFLSSWVFGW